MPIRIRTPGGKPCYGVARPRFRCELFMGLIQACVNHSNNDTCIPLLVFVRLIDVHPRKRPLLRTTRIIRNRRCYDDVGPLADYGLYPLDAVVFQQRGNAVCLNCEYAQGWKLPDYLQPGKNALDLSPVYVPVSWLLEFDIYLHRCAPIKNPAPETEAGSVPVNSVLPYALAA